MLWSFLKGDALSSPIAGELREASAGWCGTGGGSGPQHGRPCGATAPSDSALFLAASLEPAQWIPGSEEPKVRICQKVVNTHPCILKSF